MAQSDIYIEIYKSEVLTQKYKFKYSELDDNQISKTISKGVRVFSNGKLGRAYGVGVVSDEYLINKAKENLKYSEGNVYIPNTIQIENPVISSKKDIDKSDVEFLKDRFRENANSEITFPMAGLSRVEVKRTISNNRGVNISEGKTYYSFSSVAMCNKDNESETGSDFDVKYNLEEIDFNKIINKSIEESKLMIGAKSISKDVPIILPSETAIDFLGLISDSFSALNFIKGKSMFSKNRNEKFDEKIKIVDNGIMKNGIGTTIFDDEGVLRQKTELLTNGKIENLLHNTYTSNEMQEKNTGNASRSGLANTNVGETNFYIENGKTNIEEIYNTEKEFFVLKDVMGLHTVNTITGEFSLGASGYYLRNDEKIPTRGITIAGNLRDILKNSLMIGNDLKFYGSYGAPTIVLDNIKITS